MRHLGITAAADLPSVSRSKISGDICWKPRNIIRQKFDNKKIHKYRKRRHICPHTAIHRISHPCLVFNVDSYFTRASYRNDKNRIRGVAAIYSHLKECSLCKVQVLKKIKSILKQSAIGKSARKTEFVKSVNSPDRRLMDSFSRSTAFISCNL